MAGTPLRTPLGNREGEWSPEARRPLRSCHHENPRGRVGGVLDGPRPSLTAHPPSRRWAVLFPRLSAVRPDRSYCSVAARRGGLPAERPAAAAGRSSLVDDAGDTVGLPAPARRVVSLIPATTELLFAIGADAAVVGRTSYCDYPPAPKPSPIWGTASSPTSRRCSPSGPTWCSSTTRARTPRSPGGSASSAFRRSGSTPMR